VIVVVVLLTAVAWRFAADGAALVTEPFERVGVPVTIAAVWLTALAVFRTRDCHVVGSGVLEYKRVLNATATAYGLLAIAFLLMQVQHSRAYFIVALPLGAGGLLLGRWTWRRWLRSQRAFGHYLSRALIVGSRSDVEYVAGQVAHDHGTGYVVVGAVSDGAEPDDVVVDGRRIPVIAHGEGGARAVAAAATHCQADAVIVSGPFGSGDEDVRQLSWSLEGTAIELVLSSRLTDVAGPRIHFRPVEGLPLLHVEIPTFDGWRHVLKRTFDIVFATAALVLLAPVLLVIAVAVHLHDGGPVVFRQTRCGRNGRTFQMLKFRSMTPTAERDLAGLLDRNEGTGLLFKIRNDPRVTTVGRVLREHSLDELPQFWNILKGDMSVVGPRPPLVCEVEAYDEPVRRRLMIKPGLTGMWQISGRSDLSWEESVRLDLYYVENWSLTGDLMIVWRTVRAVVRPRGAY
jgi:exopolysaccharide biosynthesis polyprenyl glycosylphosphotransferase